MQETIQRNALDPTQEPLPYVVLGRITGAEAANITDDTPEGDLRRQSLVADTLGDVVMHPDTRLFAYVDDPADPRLVSVGADPGVNVREGRGFAKVHDIDFQGLQQTFSREAEKSSMTFEQEGNSYSLLGYAHMGEYSHYVFSGRSKEGTQHTFGVYKSKSEGGWRATPGYEGGSYIKGREDELDQYTQDTQLHPDFMAKLTEVANSAKGELHDVGHQAIELTYEQAQQATAQFRNETSVYNFNDRRVSDMLSRVASGGLSVQEIVHSLGGGHEDAPRQLLAYVDQLNRALEGSNIVPDFSQQPKDIKSSEHDILGMITTEVFEQGGVEWHMSSDSQGRVWVDRLRLAAASPTSYGTDKELIYSGILTSKPLDYKSQTEAILPKQVRDTGTKYVDISPFLAKLFPIFSYKIGRQERHLAPQKAAIH